MELSLLLAHVHLFLIITNFLACVNKVSGMANIYILDCTTFIINKTLSFHTRGIQDLCWAKQGKYLISIGNFRESTVAVWDF